VVMHDPSVEATTDGQGLVHMLSLAQVKRLDAGHGRAVRTEVPTLAEALSLLSGRAAVDIEIKNIPGEAAFDSPAEAVVEAALRALDDVAFVGAVLISSFNWLSIERARALEPAVATGFLTHSAIDPGAALVYARSKGHDFVLPQAAVLWETPGLPAQAHTEGIGVGTWTVDDPEVVGRLFEMGVDAVATNDPVAMIPVRDRFRSAQ